MATAKKYRVQSSSTTNTYVYCWIAAREALKRAREPEGRLYFAMMAGVFAAFTVEAYLNHLGQRRVPDWNKHERKGPKAKLRLLRDLLKLPVDMEGAPYHALDSILLLRNTLAHGRTVSVVSDLTVDDPNDESAQYPQPEWKQLCSFGLVELAVQDAETIVRQLSILSGSKRDPFASPWSGMSSVEEITTEL